MNLIPKPLNFSCFVLLLIGGFTAHAHDPGLSSATITVRDRRIDVLLGFAQRDVESLLGTYGGQVEIQSPEGFAAIQSRLESLAAQETSIRLENTIAVLKQTVAKWRDSQNIEILLSFERRNGSRLSLVSKLIERLPFGHREFVSVETAAGVTLGESILSKDANSFQNRLADHSELDRLSQ